MLFNNDTLNYLFLFLYLAAPSLSCGTAHGIFDLCCGMDTLGCSMWDLVCRPGMGPRPPALVVQSRSHWTTREVSKLFGPMSAHVISFLKTLQQIPIAHDGEPQSCFSDRLLAHHTPSTGLTALQANALLGAFELIVSSS